MVGHAPASAHLRGPHGGIRAGALLTLLDNVGGICAGLAALPNGWVVSTNLAARTVALVQTGPLRVDAAVLRRGDIGELSPGKRADFAVWRTDGLELGGASDPVAGLVFAGPHRVDRLYVGGEEIVRDGRLVRGDVDEIAREQRCQAERFAS